jgi:hypothetical protein
MGGNGSFAMGITQNEEGRSYRTVYKIGDNIMIIEAKNPKKGVKLPEESHTPMRIYATFRKDGKDVKAVALYGADGKKIYEIHTQDHHGIKPHFHYWKDNGQEQDAHRLTPEMVKLLNKIRNIK